MLVTVIGAYDIMSNTFSIFGTNSHKVTAIKNKIKSTLFYIPSKIKRVGILEKNVEILSEEKKILQRVSLHFITIQKKLTNLHYLKKILKKYLLRIM